jgi:DNA/RNA-binding domain of Phe-tRNA-synthetase-like protein
MIGFSNAWKKLNPSACTGILAVRNAPNCDGSPELLRASRQLEVELRERFESLDRNGLKALPTLAAYDSFYRQFKKTYHVQLQLESVVFKGKPIQFPSALVGAMFMAELKTGLLTAAHDLAAVDLPLTADIAQGGETYQRLNGDLGELKYGDLYIRDQTGILSSVIYGPDQRTKIAPTTDQAIFTTYGPPGITKQGVREELEILEGYLRLFAPQLERIKLEVLAGSPLVGNQTTD